MAPSEIDDIFAAKGRAKVPAPAPSSLPENKKKKKKDSAKRKRDDDEKQQQPAKRRVPETVVDPSLRKIDAAKAPRPLAKKNRKTDKEDEERFKDSRGTGPRRKTEEGFAIYKEDELGISNEGGDTPLCPFDCQCCF